MKLARLAPLALCLALGACASPPPAGPSVSAVAEPNVSDQKFARDDAACRARAQGATAQAAAAAGQFGLQHQYDSVYATCMSERGYSISGGGAGFYYGPGPYGPGPYAYGGPAFYYGWGWSGGGGWGRRW